MNEYYYCLINNRNNNNIFTQITKKYARGIR